MTAETIAKALGGRKTGSGWTVRCPAHDDRTPSLSVRDADDNKVPVHCHAGCDHECVIAMLQAMGLCVAAIHATAHPAWTALSTSGLRSLELPQDVQDVIDLVDGDEAGEATARDCALRWKREARRVRIAHPPQGLDLLGRALPTEERAQ